MPQKEELLQWCDGCLALEDGNFNDALLIFEPIADTSRIHYNMAMAYLNISLPQDAIKSLTEAVTCDPFLAVGYFVRGVLFYNENLLPEALADFTDALAYLRGNLLIDYTQLGFAYKLFAAEVSFNRGLCYAQLRQEGSALSDFNDALQTRPLDGVHLQSHSRIPQGLELGLQAPLYCRPFQVPTNVLFKPPPGKIRNAPKIEWLPKSYVVASTENDDYAGFSGARFKPNPSERKTIGPLDENAFSPSAATLSRSRSVKKGTLIPNQITAIGVSDVRATTLSRLKSVNSAPSFEPLQRAASFNYPSSKPDYSMPSRKSSLPAPSTDPFRTGAAYRASDFSIRPSPPPGILHPPRGNSLRVDRRPKDNDRARHSNGVSPRSRSLGRDASHREVANRNYDRSTTPEEYFSFGGSHTGRTRQTKSDDEGISLKRRNTEMSVTSTNAGDKLKIKCHFSEETRIIAVDHSVSFQELCHRISRKFNLDGNQLKLKYRDIEGELVLVMDQEDMDIALEGGSESNARLELWCSV